MLLDKNCIRALKLLNKHREFGINTHEFERVLGDDKIAKNITATLLKYDLVEEVALTSIDEYTTLAVYVINPEGRAYLSERTRNMVTQTSHWVVTIIGTAIAVVSFIKSFFLN